MTGSPMPPHATLSGLMEVLNPQRTHHYADRRITAIVNDSRKATAGALYVAIRGTRLDGHRFISPALENGAVALVCEDCPPFDPRCPVIQVADTRRALSALAARFNGSPSRWLNVAGVTGTDGKTSTTELLRSILNEAGRPAGSIGTLGCNLGNHWLDSDLTTPDPTVLHSTFRRMLEVGLTDACMEVSSHSLVQHRVADVEFDLAILTNITRDHLDMHGTREAYARAKRVLFEGLAPGSVAVLPAECEFFQDFRAATRAEVLSYSMGSLADVKGRIISMDMESMEILVRTPFESYRLSTRLIGAFNCMNILAAATAAFAYGIGGEVVKEALRGFTGVPGRLERIQVPGRDDLPGVCVDFAHTPDALQKVLTTLRPLVRGRLVCVIGCGGERDTAKRPIMGRIAAERADLAVFTADNSRSESTNEIIEQMRRGLPADCDNVLVEPDRRNAIELALRLAGSPRAMVAVCGRGCERYLNLGPEQKIPFDDRVVVRQIMENMPAGRRKIA